MIDTSAHLEYIKNCIAQGRLAHAWLFTGGILDTLTSVAKEVALILKCENPPVKTADGKPLDKCNVCSNCQRIQNDNHPDVFWVRPESKMRLISVEAIRELIKEAQMKPLEGGWKIAIIVAADRMNQSAANAFLKTLEEPPKQSIIILLSTEPHRLLETIVSRCQRIDFGHFEVFNFEKYKGFLEEFLSHLSEMRGKVLPRYRLLDLIQKKLDEIRKNAESELTEQSTLKKYENVEINSDVEDRIEKELKAMVEAEYRRQRQELIASIQWLLRDVWLQTITNSSRKMLTFPEFGEKTLKIASRLSRQQALENLDLLEESQKLLLTNVQESLILETMLLRLNV